MCIKIAMYSIGLASPHSRKNIYRRYRECVCIYAFIALIIQWNISLYTLVCPCYFHTHVRKLKGKVMRAHIYYLLYIFTVFSILIFCCCYFELVINLGEGITHILYIIHTYIIYINFPFPSLLTEIELGTKCIVEMDKQQTILQNPPTLEKMER